MRKITGDPNVPAGRVSQKVNGVPKLNEIMSGKIQLRSDIYDPNAFYWSETEVFVESYDKIVATWIKTNLVLTFFRVETQKEEKDLIKDDIPLK